MNADIDAALSLARSAGNEILRIYRKHPEHARRKDDGSWLTEADLASHRHLVKGLADIEDLPVLSEEQAAPEGRTDWRRFWMIDPLDGTRDFVQRTGDFAVCIARLEGGRPTLGIIHAPFLAKTWWAEVGRGAFCRTPKGDHALAVRTPELPERPVALTSRFHRSGGSTDRVLKQLGVHAQRRVGSAVKFGRLAEGGADLYARVGPTMEWDVAAGVVIVGETGYETLSLQDGLPLRFNKSDLTNPPFLVRPVTGEPVPNLLDAPSG